MKFYQNCKTYEELKREYHRLVMIHHPDRGGNVETMKVVNVEYEAMFEILKNVHVNKEGTYYKKATSDTARTYPDIINSIIHFAGIKIEICGSWVWVSGNTKPYRDNFKQLGFYWSNNKSMWYWHEPDEGMKFKKKPATMEKIRAMFGSDEIDTEPFAAVG
jgi:curved DNA-binding protein CbpA